MESGGVKYFPTRPNRFVSDDERISYVRRCISGECGQYAHFLEVAIDGTSGYGSPSRMREQFLSSLAILQSTSMENIDRLVVESGLPYDTVLREFVSVLYGGCAHDYDEVVG